MHEELRRRFSLASEVRKIYLARVSRPLERDGAATLFFSSRHKGSAKVTVRDTGDAREAGRLRWAMRDASQPDLVEVELIGPGRRHQIRATLAFLGSPLVGDALYGGSEAASVQLHAWKIMLNGVTVEAPRPARA